MERLDIQQLRELPVERVALRLGLEVKQHKALCPFHADHHPSLTFSTRYNRYHCYACGAKGSVIDLVMHMLRKDFVGACRWLAHEWALPGGFDTDAAPRQGRSGGPSAAHATTVSLSSNESTARSRDRPEMAAWEHQLRHPRLTEEALHFLFTERHLHPAVIRWLGISSTHDQLLIPYRDVDGRLLTLQQRYLGSDPRRPRFIFLKGSPCTFYNLPVLQRLRDGDDLYFSEGVTDCMALLSSGRKAIGVPSATSLERCDWTRLHATLEQMPHVKLHQYPDRDEPGERLFLQLREHFPDLIRHPLPEGCKDFSNAYVKECITKKE